MTQPQEKVAPHNVEAEVALLGAMMLDGSAIIRAIEAGVQECDLFVPEHRVIWRAMMALFERKRAVDPVTLKDELRRAGDWTVSDAYLADIICSVPTLANVEHHARIVVEKSVHRRLIEAATGIAQRARADGDEADVLLDEAERQVFEIGRRRDEKGIAVVGRLLAPMVERVASLTGDEITGVPSGFKDLDYLTAGFQDTDLILLAARPRMGKTALGAAVAVSAARAGVPVAFFSLEMGREQLVQRLLCSEARVDAKKMRTGGLTRQEWLSVLLACDRIAQMPICIDDTSALPVMELRAKAGGRWWG